MNNQLRHFRFAQDRTSSYFSPVSPMHSKAHYCFICENGERQGPFPPDKVQRMWRDAQITDAALVWREGLAEWQPIASILTRLASIRQKEYLKFLNRPTTKGMTFEEAQSQLDALVLDNPARKLALDRWDVLAQKRDEVLSHFERSKTKCPVSDFDVMPMLQRIEADNPHRFASTPSYEIARFFKSHRDVRGWGRWSCDGTTEGCVEIKKDSIRWANKEAGEWSYWNDLQRRDRRPGASAQLLRDQFRRSVQKRSGSDHRRLHRQ